MNIALQIQPNPFRFLLYTEWVMLASCGSLAVVEAFEKQHLPLQHIFILVVLGVMGLRLPNGKQQIKVIYTLIAFSLIFYGTALGYLHILPTLYLIAVIRSCFIFKTEGRYIIASLAFGLFLVHQVQYGNTISRYVLEGEQHRFWMHQLAEVLMFGLGLLFILQLAQTLILERRTREELADANQQLRFYALQIEELAAVQERNRIAREIHDSLGHALTTLNVQLQTGLKFWKIDPVQAQQFITHAQQLGQKAIKEVRKSVAALRGDGKDEEPLEVAIASLIEDFRQATGIAPKTHINLDTELPPTTAKVVYRIIQESLTNICKYANATEVEIDLQTQKNQVHLCVADNGKGFSFEEITSGFGLQGMRERVTALNGEIQIKSQPGGGCQITVEIPV